MMKKPELPFSKSSYDSWDKIQTWIKNIISCLILPVCVCLFGIYLSLWKIISIPLLLSIIVENIMGGHIIFGYPTAAVCKSLY
jgi:hypothetical protein